MPRLNNVSINERDNVPMTTQTWHATSLHLSGTHSIILPRRGTPRPYTRPVHILLFYKRHVHTFADNIFDF
ncbi:MAG: hypothetical protein HDS16_09035 [Bacteroides sp.]|nr:hypothetical protein [Bacteroides sp.]